MKILLIILSVTQITTFAIGLFFHRRYQKKLSAEVYTPEKIPPQEKLAMALANNKLTDESTPSTLGANLGFIVAAVMSILLFACSQTIEYIQPLDESPDEVFTYFSYSSLGWLSLLFSLITLITAPLFWLRFTDNVKLNLTLTGLYMISFPLMLKLMFPNMSLPSTVPYRKTGLIDLSLLLNIF